MLPVICIDGRTIRSPLSNEQRCSSPRFLLELLDQNRLTLMKLLVKGDDASLLLYSHFHHKDIVSFPLDFCLTLSILCMGRVARYIHEVTFKGVFEKVSDMLAMAETDVATLHKVYSNTLVVSTIRVYKEFLPHIWYIEISTPLKLNIECYRYCIFD